MATGLEARTASHTPLERLVSVLAIAVLVVGLAALAVLFTGMPPRPFVSQGHVVDGWAIKGEPWTPDMCLTTSCDARIELATQALGRDAPAVISGALYSEDAPLTSGGPIGSLVAGGVVVLTLEDGSQRALGIVCGARACQINASKPTDPLYEDSGGIQP